MFFQGCSFAIGTPANSRKDGTGTMKWFSDTMFKVEVNNKRGRWKMFTLQNDGKWREGRKNNYWFISNISGKVDLTGVSAANCATSNNQFSQTYTQETPKKKKTETFMEKCG